MTQGPRDDEPSDDEQTRQFDPGSSEPPPWQPPTADQPSGDQPYGSGPGGPYGPPPPHPPAGGPPPPYGQPGQPGPPPYGAPPPAYGAPAPYGAGPHAPYGVHPTTGIPYSDKQKLVAGVLQIVIPLGIGRMYIGDTGIGVAQLLVTIFTCGLGALWPFIDGILILVSDDKTDAQGRPLRS